MTGTNYSVQPLAVNIFDNRRTDDFLGHDGAGVELSASQYLPTLSKSKQPNPPALTRLLEKKFQTNPPRSPATLVQEPLPTNVTKAFTPTTFPVKSEIVDNRMIRNKNNYALKGV